MKEIQMVDLHGQYGRIKSEINTAIQQVLDSTVFIQGPEVKDFQKELGAYLKTKHVIGCANGTDALQIALMALDIKPGDEVITSNFTFIATVEVIALLNAVPVLVDVDPDTFTMDPVQLRKAITSKTKVIIPVHLFGQCANMEEILSIAAARSIPVIEDAAQALGADYIFKDGRRQKAGTLGLIGCTSFFPSKNLGCYGDGGAIFTDNDGLAEKMRAIANHGSKVKYYNDYLGINSRLDTLQAAILRVKLKELDQYNTARSAAAAAYDDALSGCSGIKTPFRSRYSTHIFHQYTLKVEEGKRDKLKEYLQEHAIPSMIYYPVPFHKQKAYSYLPYKQGDFPVTEKLCSTVLSLPMHTELDNEQINFITKTIMNFFN